MVRHVATALAGAVFFLSSTITPPLLDLPDRHLPEAGERARNPDASLVLDDRASWVPLAMAEADTDAQASIKGTERQQASLDPDSAPLTGGDLVPLPVPRATPIGEAHDATLPSDLEGNAVMRPAAESWMNADRPATHAEICQTIELAAAEHELPLAFFANLIWQESRLKTRAISPAGALGIAQFMPGTAAERGLDDPFEPIDSLMKSAEFLRELADAFGNLGLAAAAYNGGPRRVREWVERKRRLLPLETRNYVRIVTGRTVEEWRQAKQPPALKAALPATMPCDFTERSLVTEGALPVPRSVGVLWRPWGVQLAANWSRSIALEEFARMQRRHPDLLGDRTPILLRKPTAGRGRALRNLVRVPMNTRSEAEALCERLRSAGASCLVLRNPLPTETPASVAGTI